MLFRSVHCQQGGNTELKIAENFVLGGGKEDPVIVAMRGRNPDNPSDRTKGAPLEQRLEANEQGICN